MAAPDPAKVKGDPTNQAPPGKHRSIIGYHMCNDPQPLADPDLGDPGDQAPLVYT